MGWYRKAAEAGNAHGMNNLGFMYQNGYGVTQDYKKAVGWYRKAAEAGNAGGMNNLGDMYYYGYGVTQDYKEAVGWYRKAAEAGNTNGMDNLGDMYYYGYGVTQDYKEAVRWYRKAAEAGNESSINRLKELGAEEEQRCKAEEEQRRKAEEASRKPAYSLRSSPVDELSEEAVNKMLKEKGFFDSDSNRSGKGIAHQYQSKDINGDNVVIDDASGLTWQQSGSSSRIKYKGAPKYIEQLNRDRFAGYSDWRLPTLEEAMSLMESKKKNEDLYIDPVFDKTQRYIWTSDLSSASYTWDVYFNYGYCVSSGFGNLNFVRAVRSP